MSDMDVAQVLLHLVPDARFIVASNSYDEIDWRSDKPIPTREECEAAWPALRDALAKSERDASMRAEFALRADPLFFKWQRGESSEQEWLDSVAAVRAEFDSAE